MKKDGQFDEFNQADNNRDIKRELERELKKEKLLFKDAVTLVCMLVNSWMGEESGKTITFTWRLPNERSMSWLCKNGYINKYPDIGAVVTITSKGLSTGRELLTVMQNAFFDDEVRS